MKHPGSYEAIKMRTRDLFRQIGIENGSWKFCIFLMVLKNLNLTHSCISHLLQTSIIIFTCRQNTTPTAENTNYRHTRNTPHIRIMSRTIIKVIILYKFLQGTDSTLGFVYDGQGYCFCCGNEVKILLAVLLHLYVFRIWWEIGGNQRWGGHFLQLSKRPFG